jgi:hypothetical protein
VHQSLDNKLAVNLTARRLPKAREEGIGVANRKGGSRIQPLTRVIGSLVRLDQVRRHLKTSMAGRNAG